MTVVRTRDGIQIAIDEIDAATHALPHDFAELLGGLQSLMQHLISSSAPEVQRTTEISLRFGVSFDRTGTAVLSRVVDAGALQVQLAWKRTAEDDDE
jgi:hypothetical protein